MVIVLDNAPTHHSEKFREPIMNPIGKPKINLIEPKHFMKLKTAFNL